MPVTSRYADDALTLNARSEVLDLLLAHRSVRKFAPGDVTDDHLQAMVAAAQSAPTSSNLQPWSVVVVRDPERKARLATYAAGQRFVEEAPVLLVWVADLSRARRLAARAGTAVDAADYLETTIIGFVDTALAAQNAVVAAESLGLGTVFVGAIRNHPDKVAAELGLPPHAVATFGLAVGVPDPTESAGIKPRLPQAAVVHHERYDAEARRRPHPRVRRPPRGVQRALRAAGPAAGPAGCSSGWPARSRWPAGTGCARCSTGWGCRRADPRGDSSETAPRWTSTSIRRRIGYWRRMRDSNPRGLLTQPAFQASAIGH